MHDPLGTQKEVRGPASRVTHRVKAENALPTALTGVHPNRKGDLYPTLFGQKKPAGELFGTLEPRPIALAGEEEDRLVCEVGQELRIDEDGEQREGRYTHAETHQGPDLYLFG